MQISADSSGSRYRLFEIEQQLIEKCRSTYGMSIAEARRVAKYLAHKEHAQSMLADE
jgi:hypothetical protein